MFIYLLHTADVLSMIEVQEGRKSRIGLALEEGVDGEEFMVFDAPKRDLNQPPWWFNGMNTIKHGDLYTWIYEAKDCDLMRWNPTKMISQIGFKPVEIMIQWDINQLEILI